MQHLSSAHRFTSLIECDSYLHRYYEYSTGFQSTISCPYFYHKSLRLCKSWALQNCHGITPKERQWLHSSCRKRSLPWACSAGVLGMPYFLYTTFGGSCDINNMLHHFEMWTQIFRIGKLNSKHSQPKKIATSIIS